MKNLLPLLLFIFILISCKDKEIEQNRFLDDPEHSYFPMTVGSYWVYKDSTDANNEERLTTISVEKDTLMDGFIHSKFNTSFSYSSHVYTAFYKNEFGEIYNQNGDKIFSSRDFSETLEHTMTLNLFETVYHMEKNPIEISTEIGDFLCLRKVGTIVPNQLSIEEKELYYHYAKGIGLVSYHVNIFLANAEKTHRKLVEYYIAPR